MGNSMQSVAITDYTFPSLEIEQEVLDAVDARIVAGQCKTAELLKPLVADADAVITQFAPITAEVIGAMNRAKVIVRYGIGVDNVDLEAARKKGIPVCNVPDYCIDEVADHTLAFILGTTRQVVPNTLYLREGEWGLATPLEQMRTLRDQTVGIVGFGRIGREVASRLAPFKCRRLVFDPVVSEAEIKASGCEKVSMDQIFQQSTILTLHCPSNEHTKRMINTQSLEQMPQGAILVNLSRGDLVDTQAAIDALHSGHLAAAALDVFAPEPLPSDSPFRQLPNLIVSAHIASASPRAVSTLRKTAASIALLALQGKSLPNVVNGL